MAFTSLISKPLCGFEGCEAVATWTIHTYFRGNPLSRQIGMGCGYHAAKIAEQEQRAEEHRDKLDSGS